MEEGSDQSCKCPRVCQYQLPVRKRCLPKLQKKRPRNMRGSRQSCRLGRWPFQHLALVPCGLCTRRQARSAHPQNGLALCRRKTVACRDSIFYVQRRDCQYSLSDRGPGNVLAAAFACRLSFRPGLEATLTDNLFISASSYSPMRHCIYTGSSYQLWSRHSRQLLVPADAKSQRRLSSRRHWWCTRAAEAADTCHLGTGV